MWTEHQGSLDAGLIMGHLISFRCRKDVVPAEGRVLVEGNRLGLVRCGPKCKHLSGCMQVAKVLVLLHSELLARNEATLNRLRQSAPLPPTASRQERVRHLSGQQRVF